MVNNVEVNKVADIGVNNNKEEILMVNNKQLHQAVKEVQKQAETDGKAVIRELLYLEVGNQVFRVLVGDTRIIFKSGEWGEVEIEEVNGEEIEFQEYYRSSEYGEYYEDLDELSVGYILDVLESMGYVVQEQTTSEEEIEMVNNNNNGVNIDEVVNNEVNNNNKGEMKMVNNSEWIERVEVYVNVKNARTLASLIYDGTLGRDSWERFTGENKEVREDIQVGDGWLLSIVKVDNLTIGGNPDITKGLRVYLHNQGEKIEETLYLSVDEDGIVGQEDVVYGLRSREEVVEAAVNKAGLFIRDWLRYFNVDASDVDLDDLIKFYKQTLSGKNSYDTMYTETVEWLMYQIKYKREMVARLDDDRVYDVEWEIDYLDCYDMEEVRVADDLNEDHDYYGALYLTVDDYDYYKELDEAYGVLYDFKENPANYVVDSGFSSDELQELVDGIEEEVYNKFIDRFNDEDMIVMRRRFESGWYTDFILKIILELVGSQMFNYPDSYTEYPKSITEDESGTYLSIVFGGYRATVEVESVNYTYNDELWVVSELSDTIRGCYEVDEVDGYLQRVPRSK